jgi:CHASE3 domain sensor protein
MPLHSNTKKKIYLFLSLQLFFLAVIFITANFYYGVFQPSSPHEQKNQFSSQLAELNYLIASVSMNTRDLILQKDQRMLYANYETAIEDLWKIDPIIKNIESASNNNRVDMLIKELNDAKERYVPEITHVLKLGQKGEIDEAREIILNDLAAAEKELYNKTNALSNEVSNSSNELLLGIMEKEDEIEGLTRFAAISLLISLILGLISIISYGSKD